MEEPTDELLICKDCHLEFALTKGEKYWYHDKGFPYPKRCAKCRMLRKEEKLNRLNRNGDESRTDQTRV